MLNGKSQKKKSIEFCCYLEENELKTLFYESGSMLLMDPMTFPNTCPFAVISFVNKFDLFFWTISLVDALCIINLKTWLAYSWFLKLTNAKIIKSLYRFF